VSLRTGEQKRQCDGWRQRKKGEVAKPWFISVRVPGRNSPCADQFRTCLTIESVSGRVLVGGGGKKEKPQNRSPPFEAMLSRKKACRVAAKMVKYYVVGVARGGGPPTRECREERVDLGNSNNTTEKERGAHASMTRMYPRDRQVPSRRSS